LSYLKFNEYNSPWSTRMNTFISEDDIGVNLSSWNSGEINTLFITGISGSGKTTLAKKYAKDFKCTKVHLDTFWHMGSLSLDKIKAWCPLIYQYIDEGRVDKNWLKPYLAKKKKSCISISDYKEIRNTLYKFLDWCLKKKERKVIEGVDIAEYVIIRQLLEYPIILKGTSKYHSLARRWSRDWDRFKKSDRTFLSQLIDDKVVYDMWETEQNHLRQIILHRNAEMTTLKESVGTYQDSLSIYNSLTPQEKKWCSPSGRFIDSPILISRQIIYDRNRPAAFGEVYKWNGKSKNVGFIVLAVHKNHRGKGYARQVIDRCIAEIKQLGYNRLIYRVDIENTASIRLAERYGFELTKESKGYKSFKLDI